MRMTKRLERAGVWLGLVEPRGWECAYPQGRCLVRRELGRKAIEADPFTDMCVKIDLANEAIARYLREGNP